MSCAIVKSVSFNKKGNRIVYTSAESNVRPLTFYKHNFCDENLSFEENLANFIVECMRCNLRLYKSCSVIARIVSFCENLYSNVSDQYESATGISIFGFDTKYSQQNSCKLEHFIAKEYGVAYYNNRKMDDTEFETKIMPTLQSLDAFVEEFVHEFECAVAKDEKEGNIRIQCAFTSKCLHGKVILVDYRKRLIIANKTNYTPGCLRNADGTAVIVCDYDYDYLDLLSGNSMECERQYVANRVKIYLDEFENRMRELNIVFNEPPYIGYIA